VIFYYVFDVLMLAGMNMMCETLAARRALLSHEVLPLLADPVREAPRFDAALADLIAAVRAQGLEGVVAKRLDSIYEPGARSGAWRKMRLNRSQEFVIGGYTKGGRMFDAIILGHFLGEQLNYVARTRSGFTHASRERLMAKLRPLEIPECPFANLPEAGGGRWGEGLTAEKMKECMWVRPEVVAKVEFVEWTPEGHLRHARFVGITDRPPRKGMF
jgi:ATP-dependent DNA ligase